MSLSLLLGCLWVLAATVTAFLPMRLQFAPGLTLLVLAPVLLFYIGYEHGWALVLLCFVGFVSMFRNPLRYLWKRMRGGTPELPE